MGEFTAWYATRTARPHCAITVSAPVRPTGSRLVQAAASRLHLAGVSGSAEPVRRRGVRGPTKERPTCNRPLRWHSATTPHELRQSPLSAPPRRVELAPVRR